MHSNSYNLLKAPPIVWILRVLIGLAAFWLGAKMSQYRNTITHQGAAIYWSAIGVLTCMFFLSWVRINLSRKLLSIGVVGISLIFYALLRLYAVQATHWWEEILGAGCFMFFPVILAICLIRTNSCKSYFDPECGKIRKP